MAAGIGLGMRLTFQQCEVSHVLLAHTQYVYFPTWLIRCGRHTLTCCDYSNVVLGHFECDEPIFNSHFSVDVVGLHVNELMRCYWIAQGCICQHSIAPSPPPPISWNLRLATFEFLKTILMLMHQWHTLAC